MRYLLIGFSLSMALTLCGQAVKPGIMLTDAIIEDNRSASRSLLSKTQSLVKKSFEVRKAAPLSLAVTAMPGKVNVINGMDTYAVTDVELQYTVQLRGKAAATHEVTVRCKGTNESDLMRKIGVAVSRDKKAREGILAFIDEYVAEHISTCADVTGMIDAALASNDVQNAYEMVAYFDRIDGCESVMVATEDRVMAKHAVMMCKNTISKAEILANSGDERKLGKAIDMLLMIPPTADCQEEALRVAQIVNTNAQELNKNAAQKIVTRVENRRSWSYGEWQDYYRRNYHRSY